MAHILATKVPSLKTVNRREYQLLSRDFSNIVINTFGYGLGFKLLQSMEQLDSYDRISCAIIGGSNLPQDWRKRFTEMISCKGSMEDPRTGAFLFEFKDIAVEVHVFTGADQSFKTHYYSFLEIGGYFALQAAGLGYVLKDDGLYVNATANGQSIGTILLSKNWYDAIELIGFKAYEYSYYMRKPKDVFKLLTDGDYFHRGCFPEASSLPYYTEFREYLRTENVLDKPAVTSGARPWLKKLTKLAPNAIKKYEELKEKAFLQQVQVSKYNPETVKTQLGLEGEIATRFMERYSKSFPSTIEFEQFLLASVPDTISESMKAFLPKHELMEERERAAKAAAELAAAKKKSTKRKSIFDPVVSVSVL